MRTHTVERGGQLKNCPRSSFCFRKFAVFSGVAQFAPAIKPRVENDASRRPDDAFLRRDLTARFVAFLPVHLITRGDVSRGRLRRGDRASGSKSTMAINVSRPPARRRQNVAMFFFSPTIVPLAKRVAGRRRKTPESILVSWQAGSRSPLNIRYFYLYYSDILLIFLEDVVKELRKNCTPLKKNLIFSRILCMIHRC